MRILNVILVLTEKKVNVIDRNVNKQKGVGKQSRYHLKKERIKENKPIQNSNMAQTIVVLDTLTASVS